jgi:hypothetical protein
MRGRERPHHVLFEGLDWFHLAHDGDQRWTLVKTVLNTQVPREMGNFLTIFLFIWWGGT